MGSNLTRVNVQNMALDYLRQQPLATASDQTTAEGRWLGRNYTVVRDGLLRAHPWNFAIKRVELSALAEAPTYGWLYQYQPPSDWLKILPLTYDGEFDGTPIPYAVENGRILTDKEAPLRIRYVYREEDEGEWDVMFADVVALTLAMRMSHWMTGKQSMTETLAALLRNSMEMARLNDALEGSSEAIYDSEIVAVRYT
jgi:hypothetical protein